MTKTLVRRIVTDPNQLFGLHPVLQTIYAARGVQSPSELDYRLSCLLHYRDLKDIDQAAHLIAQAVVNQQRIVIIGDFDTDGATSCALAVSALQSFGAKHVHYLVPNRFHYGYGLSPEIVSVACNLQPQLIITVDNGISHHEGVMAAKQAGLKVIITDHHVPGEHLPQADAIVNPQQHDDRFASKNLAGVGVIFYVMLATRSCLRDLGWFVSSRLSEPNMSSLLDLVALGTVADLVPLDYNNRILVYNGLQWIRSGRARPGIVALLESAQRFQKSATTSDLSFYIAPKLNAAGRLTDMSLGIECLLARDLSQARLLTQQLTQLNLERRVIQTQMQQQAWESLKQFGDLSDRLGICLFNESWHQGVIGLLASYLKERYHRPSIVFAPSNDSDELKASARSIPGLHIRDVLHRVATCFPNLIIKFGGHAMAAGLTLKRSSLDQFHHAFQQQLKKDLDPSILNHECLTDGVLHPSYLTLEFAQCLNRSGPWGQAFPEPLFEGCFKVLAQRVCRGKHLQLTLGLETSGFVDGVIFNIDPVQWARVQKIQAAYRLETREYKGKITFQLVIEQARID
jgi:single-stranded-DNA-specific exonuclease